jgi:hypothetical protein
MFVHGLLNVRIPVSLIEVLKTGADRDETSIGIAVATILEGAANARDFISSLEYPPNEDRCLSVTLAVGRECQASVESLAASLGLSISVLVSRVLYVVLVTEAVEYEVMMRAVD